MVVVVCEAKQTTRTMRCEERYHHIDVLKRKFKILICLNSKQTLKT